MKTNLSLRRKFCFYLSPYWQPKSYYNQTKATIKLKSSLSITYNSTYILTKSQGLTINMKCLACNPAVTASFYAEKTVVYSYQNRVANDEILTQQLSANNFR